MCTVSWAPATDGYTLCFNRDERFTRPPGLAVGERAADGVRYLAPLDGAFGGTWLATNEFGLSLGLLNRYRVAGYVPPAQPHSRGLLLLDLIAAAASTDLVERLRRARLDRVQPFTLVAVEPTGPVLVADWDGARLTWDQHSPPGLIRTSSSVTEPEVAASRHAVFAGLGSITPGGLGQVHRSHLPERGRLSVCMHRDDAETMSYSEVTVTGGRVTFRHLGEAPCRATAEVQLTLARRSLLSSNR